MKDNSWSHLDIDGAASPNADSGESQESNSHVSKLDNGIGCTLSDDVSESVSERAISKNDIGFSDSFLHMDTGIQDRESQVIIANNLSFASNFENSGMQQVHLHPDMDINDSTIRELIVEPQNLSLKNSFLDDSSEIAGLKHLTILDLSCNMLSEINGLSNLTLLTDLNISDNNISCLEPLKYLRQLVFLNASKNSISTIDFDHSSKSCLKELLLSKNQIHFINGIEVLTELLTLDISKMNLLIKGDNQVQSLNSPLQNLKRLYARGNNITFLELKLMPALEVLDVGDNLIHSCNVVEEMIHLISVKIDGQKTSSLFYDFTNAPNLSILDLSRNKSIQTFNGIPSNLTYLSVKGCSFTEIIESHKFQKLRILDASDNNISELRGLYACEALEKLIICRNQIEDLQIIFKISKKCHNLIDLDARSNPITDQLYEPEFTDANANVNANANANAKYIHNTSDENIVKRICYRSLLTHYSHLKTLDGLEITNQDRRSSERHVKKFKKAMYCVTNMPESLFQDWNPESKPLFTSNTSEFFILIPQKH